MEQHGTNQPDHQWSEGHRRAGTSILEAARDNGIRIPTLCHHPHLEPAGACRLCIVEDEKSGRIMASCVTPVASGMSVRTDTPGPEKAPDKHHPPPHGQPSRVLHRLQQGKSMRVETPCRGAGDRRDRPLSHAPLHEARGGQSLYHPGILPSASSAASASGLTTNWSPWAPSTITAGAFAPVRPRPTKSPWKNPAALSAEPACPCVQPAP